MHAKQTNDLAVASSIFSGAYGAEISLAVEQNSSLLVHWLTYLSSYHKTGVGDVLLDAVASAIREAAGALSLGLVRPALFSMRSQIDLLLGWLYFKDHRVEWLHVNQTGDGFRLKKELLNYLDLHIPGFGARIGTLREIKTRNEVDPYRLLSAHIHAQSVPVLPVVTDLVDLVRPKSACLECAEVSFEVAEFLNDLLLAVYAANWASLPVPVQSALLSRFKSAEQQRAFFP
ncbi:hypothetical protein [Synechococcus sp. CCAP 1479/10]|uniref:hypothetical protein n=2 Tax=unclassified Synechococcus TaxID=2626047 RepID=UPI001C22432B|nr:hypothetical protein [Synechococcus sp. CCAP 1479/10]